jgi:hypothetical protein
MPARRRVVPRWRIFLVAALASFAGIVTAALWPFQNKLGALVHTLSSTHEAESAADDSPARPALTPPLAALPSTAPPLAALPSTAPSSAALPSTTLPSTTPPSTPIRVTAPPAGVDADACKVSFPAPQLVVSGPPTVLPAETPAVLGVAADGAPDGAQLVICGFAPKSVFSAGRSIDEKAWTLPASDVAEATLIPPRGFVGPMKLVVVLLNPDSGLADRRTVHLQWLPRPSSGMPVMMSRIAEVNEQLEEGKRLGRAGNLVGARAIFLRLAQNGDSRAAFLLAETYDPIALAKHQLLPPDSDPEKARLWYRRASERGSPEANTRLERLSNW